MSHFFSQGRLKAVPSLSGPPTNTTEHSAAEIFWTCLRCTLGHGGGHFVAGSDSVEASEAPPPLVASSVGSRKAHVEAQMSSFINGRSKKSLILHN